MSDNLVEAATDATFEESVLKSEVPVLVDFWAPWCGPCRAVGPVLEEIAGEYAGRARVVKINVDENKQIAGAYGVTSIPMIVLFKGGEAAETAVGARPKDFFVGMLDRNLDG